MKLKQKLAGLAALGALIGTPAAQANLMQTSIDFSNAQANLGYSYLRAVFTYDDNRSAVNQTSSPYRDVFGPQSQDWNGTRTDYTYASLTLTGVYAIDSNRTTLLGPLTTTNAVASLIVTNISATRNVGGTTTSREGQFVDVAFSFVSQVPASGISALSLQFFSPYQDFNGNLNAGPNNLIGFGDAARFTLATDKFALSRTAPNDCCSLLGFSASTPVVAAAPTPVPPAPTPTPVPLPAGSLLLIIGLAAMQSARTRFGQLRID